MVSEKNLLQWIRIKDIKIIKPAVLHVNGVSLAVQVAQANELRYFRKHVGRQNCPLQNAFPRPVQKKKNKIMLERH